MEVSQVFHGSSKGVSRMFQGCSRRAVQGNFRVFRRSSMGVLKKFQRCFGGA